MCILGGGFGGLYTAVKLESLIWPKGKKPKVRAPRPRAPRQPRAFARCPRTPPGSSVRPALRPPPRPRRQVTLVDQGERFVFKPLLYELLNGTAQPWEVAPTFAQLLAPYPVRFVQARAASVTLAGGGPSHATADAPGGGGGSVLLEGGGEVEWDYLVVALGAEPDARGVPGVRERARPFATLEDAEFVDARLAVLEAAAAAAAGGAGGAVGGSAGAAGGGGGGAARAPLVVVVGAGYAGVELASVIGERVRGKGVEVRVVTPGDDILPGAPQGQRDAARAALGAAGVRVDARTKVLSLGDAPGEACTVVTEGAGGGGGGGEFEADLVVWTAGSAPAASKFAQSLPFPSTPAGAIETDAALRVRGNPRAFALGDVAIADGPGAGGGGGGAAAYPATAQVAFQQADFAAWNVWAAVNGRPALPFRYQHLGSMMSLGAANAAVALPFELPAGAAGALKGTALERVLELAGVRAGAGGGATLEGPLAQLLRRAAYLYRQPTNEQRLSVAASWLQQAAGAAAKAAEELRARGA